MLGTTMKQQIDNQKAIVTYTHLFGVGNIDYQWHSDEETHVLKGLEQANMIQECPCSDNYTSSYNSSQTKD